MSGTMVSFKGFVDKPIKQTVNPTTLNNYRSSYTFDPSVSDSVFKKANPLTIAQPGDSVQLVLDSDWVNTLSANYFLDDVIGSFRQMWVGGGGEKTLALRHLNDVPSAIEGYSFKTTTTGDGIESRYTFELEAGALYQISFDYCVSDGPGIRIDFLSEDKRDLAFDANVTTRVHSLNDGFASVPMAEYVYTPNPSGSDWNTYKAIFEVKKTNKYLVSFSSTVDFPIIEVFLRSLSLKKIQSPALYQLRELNAPILDNGAFVFNDTRWMDFKIQTGIPIDVTVNHDTSDTNGRVIHYPNTDQFLY